MVAASVTAFDVLTGALDRLEFSSGFGAVWQLIKDANAYIEERQPWALHKAGDEAATAAVLGDCLEALRIVALLASPVIPNAAFELWRRLGLDGTPEGQRLPDAAVWGSAATAGAALEKGDALFPRLDSLVTWVDSHCHLPADRVRGGPGPRPGPGRWGRMDGLRGHRPRDVPGRGRPGRPASRTSGPPSVSIPTTRAGSEAEWPALVDLAAAPEVVGIGEAGFDLHYNHSAFHEQEAAFRAQIQLAHATDRALVIHSREAWDDTFRVLADEGVPRRTVFHCFTGGAPEAERALDTGTYLSFSGIVTFKNANDVRDGSCTRAARAHARRDGLAVPRTGAAPREHQRARVRRNGGRGSAAARGAKVDDVAAATRATASSVFRD